MWENREDPRLIQPEEVAVLLPKRMQHAEEFHDRVKAEYSEDILFSKVQAAPEHHPQFKEKDGFLLMRN